MNNVLTQRDEIHEALQDLQDVVKETLRLYKVYIACIEKENQRLTKELHIVTKQLQGGE